jgi:hypothetical protein
MGAKLVNLKQEFKPPNKKQSEGRKIKQIKCACATFARLTQQPERKAGKA